MKTRSVAEMVRHQDPLTISAAGSVQDACAAMHRRRVGAVLVVDGQKLLGIFTGRDAVYALAVGLDPLRTMVGQVMTANPICLSPHDNAIDALRVMQDGGFRHLPVVEDAHLLGIVSRYDVRAEEDHRMDGETGFFEVLR